MTEYLTVIGQALWYFLPALTANMAPVFATHWLWLPGLNKAIDGGKVWRGRRVLGPNKTWRGLVVGVIAGALTAIAQHAVSWPALTVVPWPSELAALGAGALLGAAALTGDAVKSFFKRRWQKEPGESWRPWDQVDAILGAVCVSLFIAPLSLAHVVAAVIVVGSGTYFVNIIGVKLKIKKRL